MTIVWSPEAIERLDRLASAADKYSNDAGRRVRSSITQRVRQLELFPWSGRVVPEYGVALLRELIERPYRIIYEVFPDRVEIVTIRHGLEEFQR